MLIITHLKSLSAKKCNTNIPKNTSKGGTVNFSTEEDIVLCNAFVKEYQNPIHGYNRNGKSFWNTICASFYQFLEEDNASQSS